jgi:hypothetical protein
MDCHDPALRHERKVPSGIEVAEETLTRRDDDFLTISGQYERSVHAVRRDDFSCVQCHSPHLMRSGLAELARAERVRGVNRACVECHRAIVLNPRLGSGQGGARQAAMHRLSYASRSHE